MTYSEKLKSPKWQKKRLQILEHRGWKCEECRRENVTLHVHHKYYSHHKMPWEYEDWAYSVLCEACHKIAQEQMEMCHRVLARAETTISSIADSVEKTNLDDVAAFFKYFSDILVKATDRAFMKGITIGLKNET